jgi:mannose-6-phosphate isomerase-like protein (cupin superfamily)
MPRIFTDTAGFTADRPWGAKDISLVEGASVRLHWTDQPYVWHVNDGAEVFVVLAGQVEMKYRQNGAEQLVLLGPGDIFAADAGDEHLACPVGEARVLVIERQGSI